MAGLSQTTAANSSMALYYTPLGGIERYYLTGDGESLDYDFYSTGLVKNKKVADFSTSFTYDLAGNLTQMTDPFSLLTSYQYDNLNRPQTITVGSKTFIYEYYGDGMIKAVNYPDASIRTEYTYDNINRLTALINKKGSEIVSSFSYEYDENGNITSVNENGSTTQYGYDALNRLSTITRPDGSELHYTYDSRGNRTSVVVDISNVIPGAFAYNDWEELESFTANDNTYTYTYDAQGLRTKKTGPDGTTRYHCDSAGRVIAESDASNQVTAEIIWGHKPLVRKMGSSYYYTSTMDMET
jgi:YD repeat-containing protein